MSSPRVAAIDIGTNSVLLLIAERDEQGALARVVDLATITRIGQGVDRTGELASEAIERTLRCIDRYASVIREHEVEVVAAVGTSALRDAKGSDAFVDELHARVGVRPEIISGEREAALTFDGALTGLPPFAGPVAVFDVGGGSTEIIVGHPSIERQVVEGQGGEERRSRIERAVSLNVGAVRMTERHIHGDPPTLAELDAVRADVRAALEGAPDLGTATSIPLVGVAGTVTTIGAVVSGLTTYEPDVVHGASLTAAELARAIDRLASLELAARRQVPGLDPGRADVIVGGALVVDEVRAWAGADALTISDRGVRYGLARELVAAR